MLELSTTRGTIKSTQATTPGPDDNFKGCSVQTCSKGEMQTTSNEYGAETLRNSKHDLLARAG